MGCSDLYAHSTARLSFKRVRFQRAWHCPSSCPDYVVGISRCPRSDRVGCGARGHRARSLSIFQLERTSRSLIPLLSASRSMTDIHPFLTQNIPPAASSAKYGCSFVSEGWTHAEMLDDLPKHSEALKEVLRPGPPSFAAATEGVI